MCRCNESFVCDACASTIIEERNSQGEIGNLQDILTTSEQQEMVTQVNVWLSGLDTPFSSQEQEACR